MKKKLLILGIGILVAALGIGLWGYNYFFGVDEELRAQIREEFSEDFFTFEDVDFAYEPMEEPLNKTTKEAISERYTVKLGRLEEAVNDKIDVLFQRAYTEYNQKLNENKLNQTQFARKYLQAADMLEENVEAILNDILTEMESDLKQNQLPLDLVEQTRELYNEIIREKRDSIMQRIGIKN